MTWRPGCPALRARGASADSTSSQTASRRGLGSFSPTFYSCSFRRTIYSETHQFYVPLTIVFWTNAHTCISRISLQDPCEVPSCPCAVTRPPRGNRRGCSCCSGTSVLGITVRPLGVGGRSVPAVGARGWSSTPPSPRRGSRGRWTRAVCMSPQPRGRMRGPPRFCAAENRARGLTLPLLLGAHPGGNLVACGRRGGSILPPPPPLHQTSHVPRFWSRQPLVLSLWWACPRDSVWLFLTEDKEDFLAAYRPFVYVLPDCNFKKLIRIALLGNWC